MATLREYTDGSGFYVRHSFASKGILHHVVYQVSTEALEIFREKQYRDGSFIPKALLHQLIEKKALFTNASGSKGLPIQDSDNFEVNPFNRLSVEARKWVIDRLFKHPKVKVKIVDMSSVENFSIEFDELPDDFLDQLIEVAYRVDGTDFFDNLALTFGQKGKGIPNKALQLTPSRDASLFHDRPSFSSTPPQEFNARSG